MKPQRIITSVIALVVILLSIGCERKYVPPGGISTYISGGKWVLEKIVTPSGTTTPGAAGYYQTLEVSNDGRNDYISIVRNGKEIVREIELRSGGYENVKEYTVDLRYLNGQMLRFFLVETYENGVRQGVKEMQVTPFMKEYSAAADTVRYFYRK